MPPRRASTADLSIMKADDTVRVVRTEDVFAGAIVMDPRGDTILAALAGRKVSDFYFALSKRLHLSKIFVVLWVLLADCRSEERE